MALGTRASALILLASLILVSCERVGDLLGGGPEETLTAYLDATIRGDWEAAYGYLSSKDQAVRTLAAYKAESGNEPAQVIASKTTYSVIGIEREGHTARAQVDITAPDLSGAFMDILGGAFASALSGENQEAIEKKVAEKYGKGEFPTTTKREDFTLVRESGGWRVLLDWETTERVSALLSEAHGLREAKKFSAALKKYDQALELDSELLEARNARDETTKELAEFAEKQDYIERIALYDLEARSYETYLDGRVAGIDFKLKNSGDRTLNMVEVTVYFKAADGSIISEDSHHPVFVSEFSIGAFDFTKPLKPNYIRRAEYAVKSVPSEWEEGSVAARITDIEFAPE